MQKEYILAQIREAAERVKTYIHQLENDGHFSHPEAEEFLRQTEKLYRNLSVYEHSLKNNDLAGDLKVHLKIMETVTNIENSAVAENIIEPVKEIKQEVTEAVNTTPPDNTVITLRTIELSINNRFRVANELFNQNQQEFQAALQQLNSIHSPGEAARYLDSLKQVYKWKDENPLVKSFYAVVQKRFT